MSDDKTQRSPRDASRVAIGEDYEVRHWTAKLDVTREELPRAVDAVGDSAYADTVGRAYHLKRADQEVERADGAVESCARNAHRALEKLHRGRASSDQPPELLIVRE